MQIDQIIIKNFKCFEEATFNLNPRFTVFIGDNASGKTSVLDAIAIAAGEVLLKSIDVAEREAKMIESEHFHTKLVEGVAKPQACTITPQGELFGLHFTLPIEGHLTGYGFANLLLAESDLLLAGPDPSASIQRTSASSKIQSTIKEVLNKSRTEGGVTFPLLVYYGTQRKFTESYKEIPYRKDEENIKEAYKKCLSPNASDKQFLSWYKTYEDEVTKFGQENDKLALKVFKEAIVAMIPDKRWQDMYFSFKDDDLAGTFTTERDEIQKLLFKQLSDGYRKVIGMVADMAYRCIRLNPGLGEMAVKETPGIVLIDELDLHLHPNWQKQIVDDLKRVFPKIQFIATTHSPFIVQSLKSDELVVLDKSDSPDGDPFRKSIEDIAEDEMGVEEVRRSEAFLKMENVAANYFNLIAQGKSSKTDTELAQLKEQLNELQSQFSDDPAFIALLKAERKSNGL